MAVGCRYEGEFQQLAVKCYPTRNINLFVSFLCCAMGLKSLLKIQNSIRLDPDILDISEFLKELWQFAV
jgi:hypothetical protein